MKNALRKLAVAALSAAATMASTAPAAHALAVPAPGALKPEAIKLPDGPASVRGMADHPSVAIFTGQVSYSVPVDLPAAIAGFSPKVELSYAGALGNGPLGVGWSLGGVALRRSERKGVPTFTDADELDLVGVGEGGRVRPIADGTYRVEGRGNAVKVERSGAGFVVWTSEGARYFLGTTAAAQITDGTNISAWLPERMVSVDGQEARFTYAADGPQRYLAKITWGPRDVFDVTFQYEARKDVVTSYRSGFLVTTAQRLATVVVHSFGEALRTLHLGYDETLALSRVARIEMTGRSDATGWPALTFSYGGRATPTVAPLSGTGGWVLNQRGVSFFDVDGDGLSDLLRMELGGHSFRKNLGSDAFADPQPVTGAESMALGDGKFLDLTGDSRPELVHAVGDTWRVRHLDGTTWTLTGVLPGTAGVPLTDPSMVFVDLNGDGKTDVVRPGPSFLSVYFTGDGSLGAPQRKPMLAPNDVTVQPSAPNIRFCDVNGDGLTDAVRLADTWLRVYLGKGDGTFVEDARTAYPWNGTYTDAARLHVVDLDRDGLVDLLRVDGGSLFFYPGRPGGTFDGSPLTIARPEAVDFDAVIAMADVDGNGSQDVVWSSPRGMWVLDMAGPTTAGMLVGIDNGLGKTVSFEYDASARLSAADAAAGAPWARNVPVSISVPVRMVVRTGPTDAPRGVRYGVRDGFWDGAERRFGGFLTSRERAEATVSTTTETQYEEGTGDRRELRGSPLLVRTVDGAGKLLIAKRYERDTIALSGFGDDPLLRKAVLNAETQEHYEGLPAAVLTRTEYVNDAEGRPTDERQLGRTDVTGDEQYTFRTYASDDATWVRDRVVTEGTKGADGTILRVKRSTFGDDQHELPLGQVGFGWRRRSESRLLDPARGEVWTLDDAVRYDAHGNTIAHFDGAAWHERVYDADGLFATTERVTSGGRVIAWQATYDPVLAQPLSITGPNGEPSFMTYDAFGRVTGRAHKAGLPFVVYTYEWTAPSPKNHTFVYDGPEASLGPFTGWAAGSGWRETIAVTNGAGESVYSATRLAADQYLVHGWTVRDEQGRTVFSGEPFQASGAALPTASPMGLAGSTFAFDGMGRMVSHVLPTGATKQSTYEAFRVVSRHDGLVPVTTVLDGLGRVVHTERTVGAVVEAVGATYDATGSITTLSLQGGAVKHQFTYDTLGRLVGTQDPDSGSRVLAYDDLDRLTAHTNGAGQTVTYVYDDVGRVSRIQSAPDGTSFTYHYDVSAAGDTTDRTLGRVAWIEEPTGEVHMAYDDEGRNVATRRVVNGRSLEERRAYAPSGALLGVSYDDGFAFDLGYDDAGRPVKVGSYWEALSLDARGAIGQERFGNGTVETYERDAMGQPSRVRIERPSRSALYDVTVQRTPFGAVKSVQDGDGVGLDHTAAFQFDGAGRLTDATMGAGAAQYHFAYGYDGLQNIVSRTATGPRALGVLAGTYAYGEGGKSPRQVTSVTGAQGKIAFDYDAAGRETAEGDLTLAYNAFDELIEVSRKGPTAPESRARHGYGFDGVRTWTRNADGTEQVWFSDAVTEKDGKREHSIQVGSRTVAKVSMALSGLPAPAAGRVGGERDEGGRRGGHGPWAGAVVVLAGIGIAGLLLGGAPGRRRPRFALRPAAVLVLAAQVVVLGACSSGGDSGGGEARIARAASAWTTAATVYFHQGFAAGPVLFTASDGSVVEERRYEPFGEPIDAYRETAGAGQPGTVGAVDFRKEPVNGLNKETDFNTGYSYHGARWMAPRLARWLTPDPPTKAPDPKFLAAPWDLNPYGYVRGNPLVFWDPDGQDWKTAIGHGIVEAGKAFAIGVSITVGATAAVAAGVVSAPAVAAAGTALGTVAAAQLAYDAYTNRHQLVALGQRVVSGTSTDADKDAIAGFTGSALGGLAAGAAAGRISTAVGSAVTALKAAPAAEAGGVMAVRTAIRAGGGGGGGGGSVTAKPGAEAVLQRSTATQRSIRSLQARLEEHEAKLAAYKDNPFAFDNKGDLARNASRPEVQQRIIDGRVRHLEGEIKNFKSQLEGLRSDDVKP